VTVINLPFPVSVNAMFADGKTRRHKSQKYCDWIVEAGYRLNRQKPTPIKGQVSIRYDLQEAEDQWLRDCFNFEKGVTDLLVTHGIIEADHRKILRGGEVWWNPDVEGVRVTITPICVNRVPPTQTENANERART
jgi:hypothetical protein